MTPIRFHHVVALASGAAILVGNSRGIAIGDDGIGYEAIADRLAAGRGLGYFLENRLTIWPPGWPVAMAAVDRISPLSSVGAAIALNALTGAFLVVIVHRLLVRLVTSELLIKLGTAVVGLGASSMLFGHLLMTDFAFVAVMIAMYVLLIRFRDTETTSSLIGAGVLVALAFSIRYAGIVLLGIGGLWLLLDARRSLKQRVRSAAIFGVVGAVFPAVWILRNRGIDGTALGVRYSSARGLVGNTSDLLATIGNFLLPGAAIEARTLWAGVAVVGIAIVAVIGWNALKTVRWSRSASGVVDLAATATGLLTLHVVVYGAYMLYARTTTGLNRLDFRLLNPMYLPLVMTALVLIDRAIRAGSPRVTQLARASVWAWAGLNVVVGIAMVGYFQTDPDLFPGNYERAAFDLARDSTALDALPPGCRTFSNLPNALYEVGIEAQWSPRLTGLESNDPVDDLAVLDRDVSRHQYCLVWIDLEPRYGHLATLKQLKERYRLVELGNADHVSTYKIQPRN